MTSESHFRRACKFGLAVLAVLIWQPAGALAQAELGPSQNPMAGSDVFTRKGCAECHAVNGIGGASAPDLGMTARRRSFDELAANVWNHLPLMERHIEEHGLNHVSMTAQEAGDLIAFLFTLNYFDRPGNVEIGKRLFNAKKCVVCHQVGQYGGDIGPKLDFLSHFGSPILVAAAMWNHGPAMSDSMKKLGVSRPSFTGSELIDLIAYLETVGPEPIDGPLYVLPGRPEEGRVIFVEKRCVHCHSVQGEGGQIAPDLAGRAVNWSLTEFAAAMWNKAPKMQAVMEAEGIRVPQLGGGEMAHLVAYLYSVQYFAEIGDAERGRSLVIETGCLSCHRLDGKGGTAAIDLAFIEGVESPAAVVSALWNHSSLLGTPLGQAAEWPALDASQIADVIAFLQSLEADRDYR